LTVNSKTKTIDRWRKDNRASKAYGRLPINIRNDRDISAGALVTLAYRTTFTGAYQLRPELLEGIVGDKPGRNGSASTKRNGLGRNAVYGYLRELKTRGYMRRHRKGARVFDELGFTAGDRTPQIKRCWFDGSLSLNALAAFIWLKVNPGKFARELATRFGWSRKTAQQALNELSRKGWIKVPRQERGIAGQFAATRYTALSETDRSTLAGRQLTVGKFAADIQKTNPVTELTSLDTLHKTPVNNDLLTGCPMMLFETTFINDRLLGWLVDGDPYFQSLHDDVTDEDRYAVLSITTLQEVFEQVRVATARQIASDIAGLPLAAAVVELAATLLASDYHDDICDPAAAIDTVLVDIERRIGQEGDWLTSLELIGKRVLGASAVEADEPGPNVVALVKRRLHESDVNGVLTHVREDDRGLRALVTDFDADDVMRVVQNKLSESYIDGPPDPLPWSWGYFRPMLEEERKKNWMDEHEIRPGDVPNWRDQPLR
jgi:hypothetical protein